VLEEYDDSGDLGILYVTGIFDYVRLFNALSYASDALEKGASKEIKRLDVACIVVCFCRYMDYIFYDEIFFPGRENIQHIVRLPHASIFVQ
jgi:hypothetical protein